MTQNPHLTTAETGNYAPLARRRPHVEVRFGGEVSDEYLWLRDKSDPEVIRYLEAENEYTRRETETLQPFVDKLYGEMVGRLKQTDLSVPVRRGQYLYYTRTEEGKQYSIQCRRKGEMTAPEEIVLDQNALASGHKFTEVAASVLSDDGNLLAYLVDFIGFRQYRLQIKDLRTGTVHTDAAERVTSVEWAANNRILFFTTEDETTKRSDRLFRHELGTSDFELLYHEKDELFEISLEKSRDRTYLFLLISSKDTTEVHFLRSERPAGKFQVFLGREKAHRYYLDHRLDLFYIRTNKGAKDFRVVTVPAEESHAPESWKEFVEHRPGTLIEAVDLFREFAVLVEKSEALNRLRFYRFSDDDWNAPEFSEPVYAALPAETPDFNATQYRYSYQSFITPLSVFDFDPKSGTSTLLKQQEVLGDYDPSKYESRRLWATGVDGTKIPISMVSKKGLLRDGSSPLFLYGYGSYGIGMSATFSLARLSLLDRGMSYAIAHIRGGDELGEQWREDGMLMKKKNTFQDFIDCADFLAREQWTSPDRLVIEGGSAGGLLMGVVVNWRPDLFRAVHLAVPFVDVMNTMMDATLPLTVGEYLEWGDPHQKPAYDYMKSYSPYDNLEEKHYPAMLVTTSLHDSQVMYWEPAKYVARLRTLKRGSSPLLLKIKMEPSGHGGASGRYDRLKDAAFEYGWLLNQVGIRE
ncbi:MAG: S9 family peptidase [Bryobacteraceae bacterium]